MSKLKKRMAAPSCQGEGQAQNSNNVSVFNGNIPQPPPVSTIEKKALLLLEKHAPKTRSGIITYKECRKALSWLVHLNKDEVFAFLRELEQRGVLVQIPSHGVRLVKNKEVGSNVI